jgi:hypothetical protein
MEITHTVLKPVHMLTYQQELNAANTLTTLLVRRSLTSSPPVPPRIVPDADTAVELPVRHAGVPPDPNHIAMPALLLPSLPLPASLPLLPLHILGVPSTPNQNNAIHSVSTNNRPSSLLEQPQEVRRTESIKVKKNFPHKLLEILETQEHFDILKWLPGGKAFAIMDKKRFASEILPVYLKQAKFTSFTRKLFRWNFVTVPHGPFMGVYYHELFRRDRPDLCKLMSCSSSNANVSTSLAATRIPQPSQEDEEDEGEVQTTEFSLSTSSPSSSRSKTLVLLDDDIVMSALREHTLQIAEQANRVIMIKEQLMNAYLKTRAHQYEQQHKTTIVRQNEEMEAGRTSPAVLVSCPQASTRQQRPLLNTNKRRSQYYHSQQEEHHSMHQHSHLFYGGGSMSGNINSCGNNDNSMKILQDAYRVQKSGIRMEYNARMSNLAKLRQTRTL